MPDAIIIGDGPGGLSAALFLAKVGKSVVVIGENKTAMHWAMLYNYLGIEKMHGSEFQTIAKKQVTGHGATIREERVEKVEKSAAGFAVTTEGGETLEATYLVLSEGKGPRLAKELGLKEGDDGAIPVDRNGLSAIPNVYVVGRSVRPGRSQAIISAGDGAAAALDILSREKGEAFVDWDSPPKDE